MHHAAGQGTTQPPTLPPDEAALLASYRVLCAKDRAKMVAEAEFKAKIAEIDRREEIPPTDNHRKEDAA